MFFLLLFRKEVSKKLFIHKFFFSCYFLLKESNQRFFSLLLFRKEVSKKSVAGSLACGSLRRRGSATGRRDSPSRLSPAQMAVPGHLPLQYLYSSAVHKRHALPQEYANIHFSRLR